MMQGVRRKLAKAGGRLGEGWAKEGGSWGKAGRRLAVGAGGRIIERCGSTGWTSAFRTIVFWTIVFWTSAFRTSAFRTSAFWKSAFWKSVFWASERLLRWRSSSTLRGVVFGA